MQKKFLFLLLSFFLIFPCTVLADTASSTIIMDVDSGRILYQKNSHEKKLIASITKIMTSIIVLENADINESITVGDEILSTYGTSIYLKVGEVISIKDLLYGLMLRSGNDAAIALAVHTLGEEEFIQKMNEKAQELGMKDTTFSNPHGLDDTTMNYSTAYDMAILSQYAYQNLIYRKIISTKKYTTQSSLKSYVWNNRMSLIHHYKNCVGGKNGYTPKAGKTLVSYAKNGNTTLVIVSLDDNKSYENHRDLYEKYFSLYQNYLIIDKKNFHIETTFTSQELYLKSSFYYILSNEEVDRVTTLVNLYPVTRKNKAGVITIYLDGEKIGFLDIYQKEEKKKERSSFFQKIKNWISGRN